MFISNFKVIRSSVVQKMELIKELLSAKRGTSELTVNTAELKGDLDLAKTQIGMTESLLKALSPSDTLEIFTKLEVACHRLCIFCTFVHNFFLGQVFISVYPVQIVEYWNNSSEEAGLNISLSCQKHGGKASFYWNYQIYLTLAAVGNG